MAGSERIGFVNSRSSPYGKCLLHLHARSDVPSEKVSRFQELIRSTGAIPLRLDSCRHDYVTAAVSHLPHIVAAALVQLVRGSR